MNRQEALKKLSLNKSFSEQKITKVCKKLALKYHPDKHSEE